MLIKSTIKSNEELYGDFELIPLNYDAVTQRVDFFREKVKECLDARDYQRVNFYQEHYNFWNGIRANHCDANNVAQLCINCEHHNDCPLERYVNSSLNCEDFGCNKFVKRRK